LILRTTLSEKTIKFISDVTRADAESLLSNEDIERHSTFIVGVEKIQQKGERK